MELGFQYGSVSSLGVGVFPLHHFMGSSRTVSIIEQINQDMLLGKTLLMNIEDLVTNLGLHDHICWMDVNFI